MCMCTGMFTYILAELLIWAFVNNNNFPFGSIFTCRSPDLISVYLILACKWIFFGFNVHSAVIFNFRIYTHRCTHTYTHMHLHTYTYMLLLP